MISEKSIVDAMLLNTDLNERTMENLNTSQNKFQFNSRREMLENSKLSRLPKLPTRNPFAQNDATAPVVRAVCAGCGGRLDVDDRIQITFTGCRRCIGIYGRLDAALDENSKRKKKEMLTKMVGGAK